MTTQEMVSVLIDKGHNREYAENYARAMAFDLEYQKCVTDDYRNEECSVCRRKFTRIEMEFHYRPCE